MTDNDPTGIKSFRETVRAVNASNFEGEALPRKTSLWIGGAILALVTAIFVGTVRAPRVARY